VVDAKMAATDPPTTQSDQDLSRLGQVLAHPRRQRTLDALGASDGERTGLDDLAEAVAAREFDDGTVHRVANALHHVHLPKLAESGVLTYDAANREIDPDHDRIDGLRAAAARTADAFDGGDR
jgi:hypothetical protein